VHKNSYLVRAVLSRDGVSVESTGSGHNKSPILLHTYEVLAADTLIASGLGKYEENRHCVVIHHSSKAATRPEIKATTCFLFAGGTFTHKNSRTIQD
jgi:hypothetical protein